MKAIYFLFVATGFALTIQSCREQKKPTLTATVSPTSEDSLALVLDLISKDSLNPQLWKLQYQLFMERKDTVRAIRSLRRYNYLLPEDGNGWLEMAQIMANQENPDVLVITDSLSNVPDEMIRARASYIRGLYFTNKHEDDKALAAFENTILINYTFIDAYIEKGVILYNAKKYEQALKTFQQAFKIVNNNAELYYWIGKSYEGMGNQTEAADWLKKYEALK
jgi:tetratricopeptide (TPR) repeat protein